MEKTNPEIETKIEHLKKEIHAISSNLKDLGGQKEEQYQEKTTLDKKLNALINSAKELKEKKVTIDKEIMSVKKERDSANTTFNQMISEMQTSRQKMRELKHKIVPSNSLRKQIKDLEYKMQTEALSFSKEKQIMKQIKSIKVELAKSTEAEQSFKNSSHSFKDTKDAKKKADDFHKNIQKLAAESSTIFNKLTKLSEEIENIKAKRNTVQLVLKNLKTQITQMNHKLSKILKDWSGIADKAVFRPARKSFNALLNKRTEEVKDKLKAKKKLTTDDILLLQREAMGK